MQRSSCPAVTRRSRPEAAFCSTRQHPLPPPLQRGVFALAEGPSGGAVREGLLAGVVEHLIGIDVEIRWADWTAWCCCLPDGWCCMVAWLLCHTSAAQQSPWCHAAGCPPAHGRPSSSCTSSLVPTCPALCRWEDIAEAAAEEERREEEGGLPQEEEPDIFELEGESAAVALWRSVHSTGTARGGAAGGGHFCGSG